MAVKSVLEPFVHLIGVLSDKEVAERAGSNVNSVRAYRFRKRHPGGRRIEKGNVGRPTVPDSMRSRILIWLAINGPARSEDVAAALLPGVTGPRKKDVYSQLRRLSIEGKAVRLSKGMYEVPKGE